MLKNYVIVALRNLLRDPGYTAITISGLLIGITSVLCILIFVRHELSYDRYHSKSDRIFRVIQEGTGEHSASLPFPAGPAIQHEYPSFVESNVRLFNWQASTLSVVYDNGHDHKVFNEPRFFFADSTFFKIFQFNFIEGDAATALNGPDLVVITRSTARRYFNGEEPMGKVIRFEGKQNLTVNGVIEDVPPNSHFSFDFMASFRSLIPQFSDQGGKIPENWYWNPVWTYVLLKDKSDAPSLQKQLPFLVKKFVLPSLRDQTELTLQPLTDIYLKSSSEYEISAMSNIRYIYIFSIIGAAIMLIACMNFINLTTARSAERFKEIGVRKVMGAFRISLILQFLTESVMLACIAGALALTLTAFVLLPFSHYAGISLSGHDLADPLLLGAYAAIVVFVGVISGGYPAFVLSGRNAIGVLKADAGRFSGNAFLRKTLVVIQFTMSIVLISGTIIVFHQLAFMRSARLGTKEDQIIVIPVQRSSLIPKIQSFKDELLQNTAIAGMTTANAIVGRETQTNNYKKQGADDMANYPVLFVGNDFFETIGPRILAGHDFKKEFTEPGFKAIINLSMCESLGFKSPEEAVGQVLDAAMEGKITITGVCDDFHFTSLKQKIGPLVLVRSEKQTDSFFTNFAFVRIHSKSLPETIDFIHRKWDDFVTESAFEYSFLNDTIGKVYKKEENFAQTVSVFSFLAIGLGIMGLFGLTAFAVQKRKKEISIRKVLGAPASSIFALLSSDFLILILISGLAGVPLTLYLINIWLNGFAYRTAVGPAGFVIGIGSIVVIAMATISFHLLKASAANPVDALRSE